MFEVLEIKIGPKMLVRVYGSYWELYYSDWYYTES